MFKKILQNFVKSSLKFCLISDFSPQLITCMFSQKTGSDISCKLSPVETICMKYQNLLSGKSKKKKYFSTGMLSAKNFIQNAKC